jgi:phosphatidylethanolamine/phosphatidyl-N-methylethanolamine N-methyltransferase
MKINTNAWNKFRYTLYTPGYDLIARVFVNSRKRSIDSLEIKNGDKVLIIGAGTGLDLEFLPNNCEITATDLTPSMVQRIKTRNLTLNLHVEAVVMDGQSLTFGNEMFDKIILHLILAVIPDPYACIREASRVLKKGGTVVVFDKFVPKGKKISLKRRFVNLFANLIASDLTRDFESIVKTSGLTVLSDEAADWNGNFRLIKLTKL